MENQEQRSSGRHHSHRHKKRNKLRRFVQKNKKTIFNTAFVLVALVAVIALAAAGDLYMKSRDGNPTEPPAGTDGYLGVQVEVPFFTEEVRLLEDIAIKYVERDPSKVATEYIDVVNKDRKRLDHDLPVQLDFGIQGLPAGYTVVSSLVEVCENQQFENPWMYTLQNDVYSLEVDHLKANTRYYFRISITLSDGSVTAVQGSFKTSDAPRILGVEGINNVRDIGGWKTVDGKTVRQGLLYRGSELDGAVEPGFRITAKGVNDMLTEFGIRTDMDLRAETDNVQGIHPLGANVDHFYYGAPAYELIHTDYGRYAMERIFSDLADESRYPVYMHCTYGLDRTGTVCYLLEALLGLSEEDLRREYELSALYNGWVDVDCMNTLANSLKALEGQTMQQKVEGYLLSIGVTLQEIDTIREIFLEDAT